MNELRARDRRIGSPTVGKDISGIQNRGLIAKAFTRFYLAPENTKYVTQVGYVPLPLTALTAQAARFEKGVTGSVLGGHDSVTGVPLTSFDDDEKERMRDALAR